MFQAFLFSILSDIFQMAKQTTNQLTLTLLCRGFHAQAINGLVILEAHYGAEAKSESTQGLSVWRHRDWAFSLGL